MANPVSEEAMVERRDELQARLNELSEEQTQIQRELHAISVYLDALKGAPKAGVRRASKSKSKAHRAPRGPRAPRGERRGALLDLLKEHPEGYTFNDIIQSMGVSDEREKKAVYATLQNMKRKGEILQNPNKHFVVAPADENEPAIVGTEAGAVHDETASPA